MILFDYCDLEKTINQADNDLYDQKFQILKDHFIDRVGRKVIEQNYGRDLSDIIEIINSEYNKNTSLYLFPGNIVLLHGGVFERKTKKDITCDFSGSKIYSGSLYINYRPLIENITTKSCYVLSRNIRIESAYSNYLPENIQQLEYLQESMRLEEENQEIDYTHLNKIYDGEFKLKKLKRR